MGHVIAFPGARPAASMPDAVRVSFDFGSWSLDYLRGDRMLRRVRFPSEIEARQEAMRLGLENGLRIAADKMPPPTVYGPEDDGSAA